MRRKLTSISNMYIVQGNWIDSSKMHKYKKLQFLLERRWKLFFKSTNHEENFRAHMLRVPAYFCISFVNKKKMKFQVLNSEVIALCINTSLEPNLMYIFQDKSSSTSSCMNLKKLKCYRCLAGSSKNISYSNSPE